MHYRTRSLALYFGMLLSFLASPAWAQSQEFSVEELEEIQELADEALLYDQVGESSVFLGLASLVELGLVQASMGSHTRLLNYQIATRKILAEIDALSEGPDRDSPETKEKIAKLDKKFQERQAYASKAIADLKEAPEALVDRRFVNLANPGRGRSAFSRVSKLELLERLKFALSHSYGRRRVVAALGLLASMGGLSYSLSHQADLMEELEGLISYDQLMEAASEN